jgi:arsenate reductase
MAEGWLRHLASDRFEVFSAGTRPAGLNPLAVEAMREVGIDISGHWSKHVSECFGQQFPFVITVCDAAAETCPVFPGAPKKLHWNFVDPAAAQGTPEERMAIFRRVRDEIGTRIQEFVFAERAA